ncbi:Hypothetical predicted protein [Paramuricea clavata]|uniref:Uncharacterized protein n=1 Tax=Paramuricea clavata TaxID=317549 RepID=A0A7D9D4R5_PARCT|nr:Hypothetical predicted protein [Paramuricea clavata]
MSDNQEKRPAKRKKSGAEFRKEKKAREEENKHLGAFMLNFFKSNEKREQKDDIHDTDKKLGNEAEVCEDKGPEIIEIQTNSIEQHSQTISSDDEVEDIDLGETILHNQSNVSHDLTLNSQIVVDEISGAFDPATVVGLKLSLEEKRKLIKMKPCQPSWSVLQSRKKVIGEHSRFCSQQLFHHDDCT